MCDTYHCDYLHAHHISFLLNRFSVKCEFPFPILRFLTVKLPSVTQRSVSQENAFTKNKNPSSFFPKKTIGSVNSFTLTENNFSFFFSFSFLFFFKIAKFEFKVTVHYMAYGQNASILGKKGLPDSCLTGKTFTKSNRRN